MQAGIRNPDALWLGTVKLGIADYGFSSNTITAPIDIVDFLKTTESKGISHFDTSPRYGKSEEVLGQYILQTQKTPVVSSKIDNLQANDPGTPAKMLASVHNSLSRLHLKNLDVCYLHQNELEIISDPYIHDGLTLLKQRNLIRQTGAALYSFEECEYALGANLFDVIQVPVSVFDLTYYNRFIRDKKNSARFVARSLLLQGILVNRKDISRRIRQSPAILSYLKTLDQLAEESGLTTLELALAFVFSLHGIDHYLIGTTSIENLEKDIKCLGLTLSSRTFSRVFEMASTPKKWTNPRNWN